MTKYRMDKEGNLHPVETEVSKMTTQLRVVQEDIVLLEDGISAEIEDIKKSRP